MGTEVQISASRVPRQAWDKEQRAFLSNRMRSAIKADKRWAKLIVELKRIGGEDTQVVPIEELDLGFLLANGHNMYEWKIRRIRGGAPCECHSNAALLWVAGQADAIGMGWALSQDGLWRQHSWGVRYQKRGGLEVLETTVKRLRYWGVELDGKWAYMAAFPYLETPSEVADAKARLDEHKRKAWLVNDLAKTS